VLTRVIAGFALAPAVAVAVIAVLLVSGGLYPATGALILIAAICVYGTAILVGVPAFLLTRSMGLRSLRAYAVLGATVAAIPGVPLAWGIAKFGFLGILLIAGALAGIVFGKCVLWKSNNRFERSRDASSVGQGDGR
jgi:hypothetical protein